MIENLNKEKLVELLSGRLPGRAAQERMAPEVKMKFTPEEGCSDASVLLLLYPDGGELRTVFIKRNEYKGPHSGQVSFPGGMNEPFDTGFVSTALRETEEETGVPALSVEVLGSLTPLYIAVSNFCVHPFVGWVGDVPDFKPDSTEVQYLICPTIREITDPENIRTGNFDRHGVPVTTPYFDISGEMIWGATAMMLSEFMALIGN
ncbi:MAG: CoA pyrophosphatase [Bacteroidales bacterium]